MRVVVGVKLDPAEPQARPLVLHGWLMIEEPYISSLLVDLMKTD